MTKLNMSEKEKEFDYLFSTLQMLRIKVLDVICEIDRAQESISRFYKIRIKNDKKRI